MAKPLWSNSAILTMVRRAADIVKAHTDLDEVSEDRARMLVFGHKRRPVGGDSRNYTDDNNPFCVQQVMDHVREEEEMDTSVKKRRTELLTTPHKPILTHHMFDAISSKVIPGLKSLQSVVSTNYSEIADEIMHYEQDQKNLSSMGDILRDWLRRVLSSLTPETLLECLRQPLQGQYTDREEKLYGTKNLRKSI